MKTFGQDLAMLVQEEARRNARLRFALAGVWLDEEEDSYYAELMELIKKYNLEEIDPLDNIPWSDENPRPE